MIAGNNILKAMQKWHLNNNVLDISNSLSILGVILPLLVALMFILATEPVHVEGVCIVWKK